jgi:hypothetical protein
MLCEKGEEYVVPTGGALVLRGQQNNSELLLALANIQTLLEAGGGKILIDRDQLQRDGFIHIEDFEHSYH